MKSEDRREAADALILDVKCYRGVLRMKAIDINDPTFLYP